MSKLNNLDVALELSVFSVALGDTFPKIVNDIKANIGRIPDKDIIAKQGGWKAASKGQLKSAEGYTVQLPLNSPWTSMLMFGMKIRKIGEDGEMEIQAEIPKVCKDWVHQHSVTKSDKVEA